jgi:hypothetical protein
MYKNSVFVRWLLARQSSLIRVYRDSRDGPSNAILWKIWNDAGCRSIARSNASEKTRYPTNHATNCTPLPMTISHATSSTLTCEKVNWPNVWSSTKSFSTPETVAFSGVPKLFPQLMTLSSKMVEMGSSEKNTLIGMMENTATRRKA